MAEAFEEFMEEIRKAMPSMIYRWTQPKEVSCQWIIDRIDEGKKGVDVGGTTYLCRKLNEKGCDITLYDMYTDDFVPRINDDMINVLKHFERRSLDFITTRHTIEHSISPLFQLWCYNQLLKDDGELFVIVPFYHRDWVWFPTHHNCLPIDNWLMLFYRMGFRITETDAGAWANNPKFMEQRFRLTVATRQMRLDNVKKGQPI